MWSSQKAQRTYKKNERISVFFFYVEFELSFAYSISTFNEYTFNIFYIIALFMLSTYCKNVAYSYETYEICLNYTKMTSKFFLNFKIIFKCAK